MGLISARHGSQFPPPSESSRLHTPASQQYLLNLLRLSSQLIDSLIMGSGASSSTRNHHNDHHDQFSEVSVTASYRVPSQQAALQLAKECFHRFRAVRDGVRDDGNGPAISSTPDPGGLSAAAADAASSLSDMLTSAVGGAVALTEIANVSQASIEGLLTLGTQLPMFGAVAGALLMFYGKCKALGANSAAMQTLIKTTAEAGE